MIDVRPLLADHSPQVRATFQALRGLMHELLPGVNEQLDMPDHLVAYGYGPVGGTRMRDLLVALIPHKAHVNVQLADGAQLHDPAGIVEGTGKRIRHVKCRSVVDVGRPALRTLVQQQVERRRG